MNEDLGDRLEPASPTGGALDATASLVKVRKISRHTEICRRVKFPPLSALTSATTSNGGEMTFGFFCPLFDADFVSGRVERGGIAVSRSTKRRRQIGAERTFFQRCTCGPTTSLTFRFGISADSERNRRVGHHFRRRFEHHLHSVSSIVQRVFALCFLFCSVDL